VILASESPPALLLGNPGALSVRPSFHGTCVQRQAALTTAQLVAAVDISMTVGGYGGCIYTALQRPTRIEHDP